MDKNFVGREPFGLRGHQPQYALDSITYTVFCWKPLRKNKKERVCVCVWLAELSSAKYFVGSWWVVSHDHCWTKVWYQSSSLSLIAIRNVQTASPYIDPNLSINKLRRRPQTAIRLYRGGCCYKMTLQTMRNSASQKTQTMLPRFNSCKVLQYLGSIRSANQKTWLQNGPKTFSRRPVGFASWFLALTCVPYQIKVAQVVFDYHQVRSSPECTK